MKLVRAKKGYRKVGDKYLLAKKCSKCGKWLLASTENYYKSKTGKYGLENYCKECMKRYDKQWQQTNRDRKAENNKQWYEKYRKQWQKDNKNKVSEYNKRYSQTPQGQVAVFNGKHRRRTKEEAQGIGITKDQWLEMMNFFGFRCAYSGEILTKDTRSVDHIVPISTGGDNMIWNMVPMTRSLNSSKHTNNMEEWYKEQDCYDPKRLQKIYDWQEYAYNKWGKNAQYFNTNDIQIKLI